MRRELGISFLLAVGLAAGCGDDDRMSTEDAGPIDDGGGGEDAPFDGGTDGGTDAGPTGDGNDSFDEADAVEVGSADGTEGAIDPAGDSDFYTFEGTAGTWLAIATEANPDDDPEMVDTVLTLYDSTMTQIAENDDAVPRANTDSEIIIRLPSDGTYYIEVQEFSAWADETPEGDPSFSYTLSVIEVDAAAAAVTVETEAGDDETTAQALSFSMDFQFLLGTFEDDTDVDVFSFTVGGTGARLFQVTHMPAGTDGYGSTTPAGEVWVTDSAATTVIARIDQSMGYEDIGPSLEPGDYLLWVAHPGGGAGDNDFYVGKALRGMENTLEGTAANDTLAEAEALTLTASDDGTTRSAFILAHLDSDTDVDYFSFDVTAGETLDVACGSASSGSGVQGLSVEIRDDSDAVVESATEAPPESIFLGEVSVSAGTVALRLAKTGQDTEVTGDWVRCGVHASTAP